MSPRRAKKRYPLSHLPTRREAKRIEEHYRGGPVQHRCGCAKTRTLRRLEAPHRYLCLGCFEDLTPRKAVVA